MSGVSGPRNAEALRPMIIGEASNCSNFGTGIFGCCLASFNVYIVREFLQLCVYDSFSAFLVEPLMVRFPSIVASCSSTLLANP